jgi:hypothetical protein
MKTLKVVLLSFVLMGLSSHTLYASMGPYIYSEYKPYKNPFDFNLFTSNFNLNLQQINPAFTGLNHRFQFSALSFYNRINDLSPNTMTDRVNQNNIYYGKTENRINGMVMQYNLSKGIIVNEKIDMGIGLSYTRNLIDAETDWNSFNLNASIHYKVKKGTWMLGLGLLSKTMSSEKFRIEDTWLEDTTFSKENNTKLNTNLGVVYECLNKNTKIGFSLFNLANQKFQLSHYRGDQTFSKITRQARSFVLNFDKKIRINNHSNINSQALLVHSKYEILNCFLRTEFQYKRVGLGVFYNEGYNSMNSLGPLLSYESKTGLKVQYCFRLTYSEFVYLNSDFHELGLAYTIKN